MEKALAIEKKRCYIIVKQIKIQEEPHEHF